MREYFGTDGIRGRVNDRPMDAETALRVGLAAGRVFTRGNHKHRVVIGKDTRLSGYMLESALVAGFTSVGMDVFLLGPMPTPAVAMLTRSLRCDLGVMISASHNPYYDNGIKLFGPDGFKLSDEVELEIERLMNNGLNRGLAQPDQVGRAKRIDDAQARYIEFAKNTFPRDLRLDGIKVVIDCANGAAYKVAPDVLWELGADIVKIGCEPNGYNINEGVGSTAPGRLREAVLANEADIGIALDGDADRVLVVDENGATVDGDQIMALIAREWQTRGLLRGDGLVATVMSNLGMERYLESLGLSLERAKVGDRYVVERMRQNGINVGGEQSGHIVLSDFTTTGDGLIAGLQVLAHVVKTGRPASECCRLFDPLPQVLRSLRYGDTCPLDLPDMQAAVEKAGARLQGRGRLVVRKSGTEPVVRVMAEGDDAAFVSGVVDDLCALLSAQDGKRGGVASAAE